MSLCGNSDDAAKDIRQLEAERQIRINQGMGDINRIFSGFDPSFYGKRQQDYINYAMPQFGDEARRTQNQLIYSLTNRGLGQSGAGSQAQVAFDKEVAMQQQSIVDAAFGQANELRKQVEGQRSSLIGQLQASADPKSTAQQALASATQFNAPSVFQPIGSLLSNFANIYLANQIANSVNRQQQTAPAYGAVPGYGYAPLGSAEQIRRR